MPSLTKASPLPSAKSYPQFSGATSINQGTVKHPREEKSLELTMTHQYLQGLEVIFVLIKL